MAHDYKKLLEDEGYILEQIVPHHRRGVKILIGKCPNGHSYESTTSSWGEGSRCKNCYYDSLKSHDYKKEVAQAGYTLIKQDKQKLKVSCSLGHIYDVYATTWNEGARCKQCFIDNQKNEVWDKYNRLLIEEGYKLLEIKQTEHGNRLICKCPNNHDYEALYNNWSSGYRCSECYQTSWTIERVKDLFEKEQYQLLSTEYKTTTDLYDFICPEGHQHKITLGSWLQGSRCGVCKLKPIDPIYLQQQADLHDLLLKSEPKTHTDDLTLQCKICDHVWNTNYFIWTRCKQRSCVKCRGYVKWTFQEVKDYVEKFQYKLLSTEYKDSHTHLDGICPSGHPYRFMFTLFQQGYRCGKCTKSVSSPEKEIYEIYKHLNPKTSTRSIIKPKELDLYFKDQNIAIEYCGLYWHGDKQKRIYSKYHYDKMKACNDKQIKLIHIFEDDWIFRKSGCLSILDRELGIIKKQINIAECKLDKVSKIQAQLFIKENSLDNKIGEKFYGIYYKDNLVQLISYTKRETFTELNNLIFDRSVVVIGGVNQLIDHLKKYNKDIEFVIDMKTDQTDLFESLGFVFVEELDVVKYYVRGLIRSIEEPDKYDYLFYDCGHQRWRYRIHPLQNIFS